MMLLKNKGIFFPLFFAIVLLSGCTSNEKSVVNHYYLLLTGESQTWKLTGYEMVITPEKLKAGNGTLHMKNKDEYITANFHFETHAVINGEDEVIHAGSASGEGIDIAEQTTGVIEGDTYLNEDGDPITLNEISEIYMMVEWWDVGEKESVNERIDLYTNKDQTILN